MKGLDSYHITLYWVLVFSVEDGLTRSKDAEWIELRFPRQKLFPSAPKMVPPPGLLGVVGQVLLGTNLRLGGALDYPVVLLEQALQAFLRTSCGIGRLEHAHYVEDVFAGRARLRQNSRCIRIPPA